MKGYKIRYGEYGHDCWGASEWFGWYDYDNVIYTDLEKAKNVCLSLEDKERDKTFEIYNVEIK